MHFERDSKCNTVNGVKLLDSGTCCDDDGKYIWAKVEPTADPYADKAAAVREERLAARRTDPATSKGKHKVNKYEQAVLDVLAGAHHTGKEIAAVSGQPLNSITPRFAPLCRKGLIKDSGVRRDKQIVWVLA